MSPFFGHTDVEQPGRFLDGDYRMGPCSWNDPSNCRQSLLWAVHVSVHGHMHADCVSLVTCLLGNRVYACQA